MLAGTLSGIEAITRPYKLLMNILSSHKVNAGEDERRENCESKTTIDAPNKDKLKSSNSINNTKTQMIDVS